MRRSVRVYSTLTLSSVLSLVPGLVLGQEAQGPKGGGLETIIVTAQKRAENLQVVPVAVTALTSQSLNDMRFENIGNLSSAAPGTTVRTGPGGIEAANVTMRGVYGSGTFASDPGVSLYQDGMYLSSVNGAEFDLADVERIEILRGPQGTLFGRNAIGGAVNVITREPTGQFDGYQQFSYGNFNQFRAKTHLDLPAWGALSASINYLHDQIDGDVRNLGAGTVWNYGVTGGPYGTTEVSPKTLGGHDTNAVAATLKLEPGADIKVIYRFNYSHKDFVPDAVGIQTFNSGGPLVANPFYAIWNAENPAIRTPVGNQRPDAVNNWYSIPGADTDQSHALTVTVPVNDSITLKDLTAYRKVSLHSANNLSGEGGILAAPNVPILPLENATQSYQRSFQEELQANVDTKWTKSTFGYMHFFSHTNEGGPYHTFNSLFGSGLFPGVPTYTNFAAPFVSGVLDDDVHLVSDAVYSQNEIHVMPKLDLVLGGRYTWDRRGGLDNSPTPTAPGVSIAYDKSTPTYLIGLNYKVTDDIFTYAKLSTAYITGGRLANVPFKPTVAKSYEAGIKSDLLDHKLRINLAGYTVKYTAAEVLTTPHAGCAPEPGVSPYASQCIVDGGNEKANGAEAEVTFVPVNGLTISGNLSYIDASLSKTPPLLLPADGFTAVEFVPKWTGDLSVTYHGPDIDSLRSAHVIARAELNYTSSQYGSQPGAVQAIQDATKIPTTALLDVRLGLGGIRLNDSMNLEIAGYAKNLTNNRSIYYNFNAFYITPAEFQEARTYGIDLIANF